jgi:hypothetical protein
MWAQIIIKNQNGEMYFYDQYQFEDPVFMDARKKGKKRKEGKHVKTEDLKSTKSYS